MIARLLFLIGLFALALPAGAAEPEKKIFVKCEAEALRTAFDDEFDTDSSQKVQHPISGEEISILGDRDLGTKVLEDQRGNIQFRERRKYLENRIGRGGLYEVFCDKRQVISVALTFKGTLMEFYAALTEKYGSSMTRNRFIEDVNSSIDKGLVILVKETKDRVITATIVKRMGENRIRVRYYKPEPLEEELSLLRRESELRREQDLKKSKKTKDTLL